LILLPREDANNLARHEDGETASVSQNCGKISWIESEKLGS
jgi:hypothetical protein